MAEADPLAQLRDIHLPNAIGWWPLAPGWYILMGLLLLLLSAWAYFLYKKALYARAKKQALALLQSYEEQYTQDNNGPLFSARISELLRRVALVYYPRHEVASLQGEAWLNFLNKTSRGLDFNSVKSMLLESPFKNEESTNLQPLLIQAKAWIKGRGKPCSN